MKYTKLLYCLLCGIGAGLVGTFLGRLTNIYGIVFFTIGVALIVFSIAMINREK